MIVKLTDELIDKFSKSTLMIRFSTLLPIRAPFWISTPKCVFINKHPYSNKRPYSNIITLQCCQSMYQRRFIFLKNAALQKQWPLFESPNFMAMWMYNSIKQMISSSRFALNIRLFLKKQLSAPSRVSALSRISALP